MYGLKHRLRGVDMATLRVCVRGFAVSRHFMSVVRVITSNCRKPLIILARRQTHSRKPSDGPQIWPLDGRQST